MFKESKKKDEQEVKYSISWKTVKSDLPVKKPPREIKINWAPYESEMIDVQIAVLGPLARIADYKYAKPFYKMFDVGR